MTKLNKDQLAVMAAIMGLSNAGQDSLFKGPFASVTVEDVKAQVKPVSYETDRLECAVVRFGGGLFENEEMLKMFVDEAKAWVKTLRPMPVDKIKSTWPDYAKFVDAII